MAQRADQAAVPVQQQAHADAGAGDPVLHDGRRIVALHARKELRIRLRRVGDGVAVGGLEAEFLAAVRLDDNGIVLRRHAVILPRHRNTEALRARVHRLLIIERVEHGPGRDEKIRDLGKPLPLRGDRIERDRTDTKQHRAVIRLQQRREPVRVVGVGRSAVDPPESGAAARGRDRRHSVHVGTRLRHDHLIARAVQRAHRRDGRPVFSVGHDGCFHVRSLPLLARSCRSHAPYDTKPVRKIQDGAAGALPKKQSARRARETDPIRNGCAQVCSCPGICGRPRSAGRETPSRNSAPCSKTSRGSRSTPARPRAGARAAWTAA